MTSNMPQQDYPTSTQAGPDPASTRNTLAIIALITAVLGVVFSCIEGALIVGWILLPISFVLSIVALVTKNKKKGMAITALIISIVGPIIAGVFFLSVVGESVDEAFGGETSVSSSSAGEKAPAEAGEDKGKGDKAAAQGGEAGSIRENPLPIGVTIENNDWAATVNSVNLDGDDIVAAANSFNEPAGEGKKYIIVNITQTLKNDAPEGRMPDASVEYVSPDGVTHNSFDSMVTLENQFDSLTTIYKGASVTGDVAIAVPADTAGEGVLAIRPGMFGDKKFVAVK
ncbi:DUF4190 domain-containing protein [Corynebacterium casei]|uniref:DUF4190 domain-containing protein n=1 Tax=Corynebacterium casei TaxID=160386 RepID=UPI003FD18B49